MNATWPRILEWDCAFFGARIASLPLEARSASELAAALEWCGREKVQCLYALSDERDEEKRAWLAARGARLVDERTTLAAKLAPGAARAAVGATRPVREDDIPALEAIAAEAHRDSRFWNDPRFARERCAALYSTWIAGESRGRAAAVFVVEHEGRPAGYISCRERGEHVGRHGDIGLVAVAAPARGRGLGGLLVDAALDWAAARGMARMEVVTQGRNSGALALYASRGFQPFLRQRWQHLWLD
ncbi:MAG: hypothetical protein RIR65_1252 [Planctomycetota bacterium]